MKSRFLHRLESKISASTDRFSRRCLLAERAAYQARLGCIELSRNDLAIIKGENDSEPHVRVSILINIADGLCHYYEDMSPKASDRYQRARALAVATSQMDLQARVDSYIALLAYGEHRFEQMFAHLDDATRLLSLADRETLCRVCMILGQTLHLANRFDLAQKWYQKARYLANEVADDASMSAILHNMASIWFVNLRNCELGGIETGDRSEVAWVAADSTKNYDTIIGSTGLDILTPLMKAQMLSLNSKYEEALLIYKSAVPKLALKSLGGWQSWIISDMALCNLRVGHIEDAQTGFSRSLETLSEYHHLDDRAATFTRLSEGMAVLGKTELATHYRILADQAWAAFVALQNEMRVRAAAFMDHRESLLMTKIR
ncbi:hypothetical protein HZ992_02445 [Rhizobacter sp. AJA081-3]|uniref:hypothetical protein n=1 Tax=Rhizobacter sp. AJA081-3 TaxID=2753607 RepID=UPI001ADFFD0A|nr:hypothetical protein [Rhizobacter sp. AJA081-3]QTN23885.1 hypothetical protein HZ992_02445 [Rhizobacter sp. AJA081-3]